MNYFTWTDLSTFEVESTKNFYTSIFGWEFYSESGYEIAYEKNRGIAAMYEMPDKFKNMNMPSFWMSYIRVVDLESVVLAAKKVPGTIVEIEPTEFGDGKIALIRDPSGAGFTAYEGPDLTGRFDHGHGKPVWNVLYVNDIELVKNFYETVLEWTVTSEENGMYELKDSDGTLIAHIEVWPDEIKGKEQYWIPIFEVENLKEISEKISELGGAVICPQSEKQSMAHDPKGGGFIIKEL